MFVWSSAPIWQSRKRESGFRMSLICDPETYLRSDIWIKYGTDLRDQRSEIRDQRSEIRDQSSEFRDQSSEFIVQRSKI